MTLYCSAAIFQKAIPLKTARCLSEASSMLFRKSRRKIAELYSVLTFFASFFVSRQKMKKNFYISNMKKTIFITGGAGFIGSHVVREFVNKYPSYHIVNVDALTYA